MKHQYELDYETSASGAIKKVASDEDRDRLQAAINALIYNPRPRGCKKLPATDGAYRIRVGDWRVIYVVIDKPDFVVVISGVARRNERTYKRD